MKKVTGGILVVALLFSITLVPMNSFAAYGDPITLTASSATGAAGDEIVISLNISANSGLAAAGLYLEFDNTKLGFTFIENDDDEIYNPSVGYAASQTGASSVFNYFIEGTTTKVSQNFIREAGTNRAGALMNVTLNIKSGWSGSTPIIVSYRDDFADAGIAPDYEPRDLKPFTTIINGSVTGPSANNVTLSAKAGKTTVIDEDNHYVFGLTVGITKTDFENNYIEINGNGRLEYPNAGAECGTGTQVDLYNNDTNTLLESYYIVIFGDVTGDGNIDSNDAGILTEVENYNITWVQPAELCYIFAGDIDKNGNIDSNDAGTLVEVENYNMSVNQVTGLAYLINVILAK